MKAIISTPGTQPFDTHGGIKRAHGTAQATKAPTLTPDLKAMFAKLPYILLGKRLET